MGSISIDWESILGKCEEYIKSDTFKSKVNNASSGNSSIAKTEIMEEAGTKLAEIITECAMQKFTIAYASKSKDVPSSIVDLLTNDIQITSSPYAYGVGSQGFTKYRLDVGFVNDEDLFRPALRWKKGKSPYKGVDNIISLFDTGYYAKNKAYGYNSHGEYITSPTHYLDGMAFMSEAVEIFNAKYGNVYNCQAFISADPQFYVRK